MADSSFRKQLNVDLCYKLPSNNNQLYNTCYQSRINKETTEDT